MKTFFKTIFLFVSKHFTVLSLITTAITALFSILYNWTICVPFLVLPLLVCTPFALYRLYIFIVVKKRTFKPGDEVQAKGSIEHLIIENYLPFSKTKVKCFTYRTDEQKVIRHVATLEPYDTNKISKIYGGY